MPVVNIGDNEWILELEDLEKDSAKILQMLCKSDREVKGVRHQFLKGDVLYSKLRTYLNKVLVAPSDGYCTTEIIPFRSYCDVSTQYLNNVLRSKYFLNYTHQCGYGVKMPRLSTNDACKALIPIPPFEEQRRIVEEIERWFSLIDLVERDKCDLNLAVSQSKDKILELAMQGKLVPQDPADEPAADMLRRVNPKARIITDNPHYPQLPDNWVWISIEDLNEYKPKSINPAESPSEIFDLYSVPIFPTGHPEKVIGKEIGSTKQSVQYGDVLLCKINPHLNRVWTIEEVSDNMQIASSEWIVIRSSSTYSTYLRWLFSSPFFRKLLYSQVSGVGGSLTRAQPAVVKKYLIPIPPYNEQIRIVSKIVEILSALTDIDSNLAD